MADSAAIDPTDYLGEKSLSRDLSVHRDRLAIWTEEQLGGQDTVTLDSVAATSADSNGFAGENFLVGITRAQGGKARTERLVLRRKPKQHAIFPEHDFDAEAQIQAVLSKDGRVPVAPFIAYETSEAVVDGPFYIMEFVDGRVPPDNPSYHTDGWVTELSPGEQKELCESGLAALASLHSIDPSSVGADFLYRAQNGQSQTLWNIEYWARHYDLASEGRKMPLMVDALDWIRKQAPTEDSLSICWGDARPGNIIFKGTTCAAIIDWDMVSIGNPLMDLAYWIIMDIQFRAIGGQSKLVGWLTIDEMVAYYEEASARPISKPLLDYYRVFAAFQLATLFTRHINLRSDMDESGRMQFINDSFPPISILKDEFERVAGSL